MPSDAKYKRNLFKERREAGLCYRCGVPVEVHGKLCPACSAKVRADSKRWKDARKAMGICVTCGKNKAAKGHFNCPDCLDRFKIYSAERYQTHKEEQKELVRKRKERLQAEGKCYICGGEADRGKGKICSKCLPKTNATIYASKKKNGSKKWLNDEYTKSEYEVIR